MKSDKMFYLIAAIALTVGVLGNIPGLSPLSVSQELIGKFVVISLIALFLLKNIWLKLFLLWCVVRTIIFPIPETVVPLYTTAFYFVMFQILADNLTATRVTQLLNIICIIAFIQVLMMSMQYCGVWWSIIPINGEYLPWDIELFTNTRIPLRYIHGIKFNYCSTGFTGNLNFASSLLGLCFPAFLRKGWYFGIPVLLWGIYMSVSFQGFVIIVACACVFAFMKFGAKKGSIITGSIALLFLVYAILSREIFNFSWSERLNVWPFYVKKLMTKRWIIGWGLGQAKYLWYVLSKELKLTEAWLHSHNEFITLWTETGIIGFGLIMAFLGTTMVKLQRSLGSHAKVVIPSIVQSACLKSIKSGTVEAKLVFVGIIAGLLSCFVNFTAHLTIGIVFLMYLSMAEYLTRREA